MKLEGLLPCSQDPSSCSYCELDESSSHPPIPFHEDSFQVIPSTPRSSKCSLSFMFSYQNHDAFLFSPVCSTCSNHHIFPDFCTWMIFNTSVSNKINFQKYFPLWTCGFFILSRKYSIAFYSNSPFIFLKVSPVLWKLKPVFYTEGKCQCN